ncbi:MAG: hypothetical protein ACTSVB_11405 [Candidatus Heimdallarchaeaceae archaeon]
MRISIEYSDYNRRRYSRPWIAKVVSWQPGKYPQVEWGEYYGDDSGGECVIEAESGDIIRTGRKDYRRSDKSYSAWFIVEESGELTEINMAKAAEYYQKSEVLDKN